jgi:hypothetical protein
MEKTTLEFLRNLKLVVNKMHIRFEDDLLKPEKPYSIGIIINVSIISVNFYLESIFRYNFN